METELKLLIDTADKEKLRRHPLLGRHASGKPKRDDMIACYFDTPDFHLRRHDAGLRVRKSGGKRIQTLKAGGSVQGGLHQRHEWECPVDDDRPDLEKLRGVVDQDTEWAAMLNAPSLANRLQPLFSVRVERTAWDLRIGDDEIELVLDEGTIERDGKAVPVSEIELELKSGEPGRLYELALELLEDIPMRLDNRSKAERGYALCGGTSTGAVAVKARPPALTKGCTVEQGLQKVLAACLEQIQGNEAGIVEHGDAESLHQMRVGLRRLRSALRLFGKVAPFPPQLREGIAWLVSELGAARDWDVLEASTLAHLAGTPAGQEYLTALQDPLREAGRARHAQASRAVLSTRYARLLVALFAWMQGARWREGLDAESVRALDQPLTSFACEVIRRGHRKVARRARKAALADPHGLHRLRIAAKQNRYAMAFFGALFPAKRVRSCLAALTALQDELGWRNDLAVADGLLQQLPAGQADARVATAFARGYLAARLSADEGGLRTLRKRVRGLKLPFKP
jgi:inorganic triphosphatase YgiF